MTAPAEGLLIRRLSNPDLGALQAFLAQPEYRDWSMFLRANSRAAGLDYEGKPLQGVYVGAFSAGQLLGVVAHSWSGMLLFQAPLHAVELTQKVVAESGRPVTGFSGPAKQVQAARRALGLFDAPARLVGEEHLYGLDLAELIVPAALERGEVVYRPPLPAERETLLDWRVAYDIESLGGSNTAETRVRAAEFLDAQIREQRAWVALVAGRLVSLASFNCALPEIVQLGGIYTPPELRNRGYARAAVGAALLVARERGATRAVLFTKNPSAMRCYAGLGFRELGEFELVLL